jgi:ABC-type nitrate/sulfonate/bicarbonate transport system substrate-binding protein
MSAVHVAWPAGILAGLLACAAPAPAQDLKSWRQAMIIPKADAGFFLMAARRGFAEREGLKVAVLDVKDDPIGMKALLSGEVDSYEGVFGAIARQADRSRHSQGGAGAHRELMASRHG